MAVGSINTTAPPGATTGAGAGAQSSTPSDAFSRLLTGNYGPASVAPKYDTSTPAGSFLAKYGLNNTPTPTPAQGSGSPGSADDYLKTAVNQIPNDVDSAKRAAVFADNENGLLLSQLHSFLQQIPGMDPCGDLIGGCQSKMLQESDADSADPGAGALEPDSA